MIYQQVLQHLRARLEILCATLQSIFDYIMGQVRHTIMDSYAPLITPPTFGVPHLPRRPRQDNAVPQQAQVPQYNQGMG